MGRAPCCEKVGLKRGPWSKEEDELLINYINKHGHPNWRALPKLAGLLRCGKSCRLRWANYLKPDIRRGNFTPEEEDTIINLHQVLGNRWSAIAARLPGRTDNEIKNIWHTRLKKKLDKTESHNVEKKHTETSSKSDQEVEMHSESSENSTNNLLDNNPEISSSNQTNSQVQEQPNSPLRSSSSSIASSCDVSSKSNSHITTTATSCLDGNRDDQVMLDTNLVEADDDFWSEVLWAPADDDYNVDLSLMSSMQDNYQLNSTLNDNWFWDDLLSRANEFLLEMPEL